MDEKQFIIVDEDGQEVEFEIILTFQDPKTSKNYVVYKEMADTDEVMAAEYVEKENGTGTLLEIESDEEFDMIQEVLDTFTDED
jgi:uncharacterized protein YrzB (UPF0473 family)